MLPQDTPIAAAVKAYRDLDIVATPQVPEQGATFQKVDLSFADEIPMAMFTVKDARKHLAKKQLDAMSPGKAPTYGNMKYRKPYTARRKPAPLHLTNKMWDRVFMRLHAKERYPNEKDFLYKLYHNAIWTDGFKQVIGYKPNRGVILDPDTEPSENEERGDDAAGIDMFAQVLEDPPADAPLEGDAVPMDARCKRCKPYQFESKSHAFWFCPE
ncbi:hypothetical protein CPB97_005728, partial [Podila verticillata]